MISHKNIWLPDGESHLTEMIDKGPIVDGKGTYQIHKLRLALQHTPKRRAAIDVGAHVGLWAMHLAKEFQQLLCFEPIPAHQECFMLNMEKAPARWTLYPWACGEAEGTVAMRVNPTSSGDTWVDPDATDGDTRVVKLDDMKLKDVDFIKIDCEGYELFVLRGATELIKRDHPTIIVEQKPGRAEKFGLGRTDAVPYLESLGMKLITVTSGDYVMGWPE